MPLPESASPPPSSLLSPSSPQSSSLLSPACACQVAPASSHIANINVNPDDPVDLQCYGCVPMKDLGSFSPKTTKSKTGVWPSSNAPSENGKEGDVICAAESMLKVVDGENIIVEKHICDHYCQPRNMLRHRDSKGCVATKLDVLGQAMAKARAAGVAGFGYEQVGKKQVVVWDLRKTKWHAKDESFKEVLTALKQFFIDQKETSKSWSENVDPPPPNEGKTTNFYAIRQMALLYLRVQVKLPDEMSIDDKDDKKETTRDKLNNVFKLIGQAKTENEKNSILPMFFNDKNVNAHTLGSLFELYGGVVNLVEETEKTALAVEALTAQVKELENQTKRDEDWHKEYATLAKEVTKMQANNEKCLLAVTMDVGRLNDERRLQIRQQGQSMVRLRAKLTTMDERMALVEAAQAEMKAEQAEMKAEQAKMKADNEELRRKCDANEEMHIQTNKKVEEMKTKQVELEQRYDKFEGEIAKTLHFTTVRMDDTEKRVEKVEGRIENAEERVSEAETRIKDVDERVKIAQEGVDKAEKRINDVEIEVQQVGSDLLEHKEHTKKLIKEHKKRKERTEELIVEVDKLNNGLYLLDNDLKTLKESADVNDKIKEERINEMRTKLDENEKLVNEMRTLRPQLEEQIETLTVKALTMPSDEDSLDNTGETYPVIYDMVKYCDGQKVKIEAKLSEMEQGAAKVRTWRDILFP